MAYVTKNVIAGLEFGSWEALDAHLERCNRSGAGRRSWRSGNCADQRPRPVRSPELARSLAVYAQPSIDSAQIQEVATLRWVANVDTLLPLGMPGAGKTHLEVALCREAVRQAGPQRPVSRCDGAHQLPGQSPGPSCAGGPAASVPQNLAADQPLRVRLRLR